MLSQLHTLITAVVVAALVAAVAVRHTVHPGPAVLLPAVPWPGHAVTAVGAAAAIAGTSSPADPDPDHAEPPDDLTGPDDDPPPPPTRWQDFVEGSFDQLLRDAAAVSFAHRLPRHAAEDVLHEAVIGLAGTWERARAAEKGPRAVFFGILHHKASDLRTGRGRQGAFEAQAGPAGDDDVVWLSTWATTEDTVADRVRLEAVMAAVSELPWRQREAVTLVKLFEYTPAEAAELLETTSPAVRQALHVALTTLRAQFPAAEPIEECGP